MRPAVDALRRTRTVRTFSLNEEDGSGDPFDHWVTRIDTAIDELGVTRAALVGVSFGGLIAVHYAALRPERVAAVVLVSTPAPGLVLGRVEQQLLRRPVLLLPMFAIRGLRRLLPEVWSALDSWPARVRFLAAYGWQVVRRPIVPRQSSRWVRAWQARDLTADCARVVAPVHVITGEPALDRVVPVISTREYLTLIPCATSSTLPDTGHIGLVSNPAAFAALVDTFLNDLDDSRSRRTA
jgi:pimeloyl-ACP methyl ester carboxylesterase